MGSQATHRLATCWPGHALENNTVRNFGEPRNAKNVRKRGIPSSESEVEVSQILSEPNFPIVSYHEPSLWVKFLWLREHIGGAEDCPVDAKKHEKEYYADLEMEEKKRMCGNGH
jgi:hypothetical protein